MTTTQTPAAGTISASTSTTTTTTATTAVSVAASIATTAGQAQGPSSVDSVSKLQATMVKMASQVDSISVEFDRIVGKSGLSERIQRLEEENARLRAELSGKMQEATSSPSMSRRASSIKSLPGLGMGTGSETPRDGDASLTRAQETIKAYEARIRTLEQTLQQNYARMSASRLGSDPDDPSHRPTASSPPLLSSTPSPAAMQAELVLLRDRVKNYEAQLLQMQGQALAPPSSSLSSPTSSGPEVFNEPASQKQQELEEALKAQMEHLNSLEESLKQAVEERDALRLEVEQLSSNLASTRFKNKDKSSITTMTEALNAVGTGTQTQPAMETDHALLLELTDELVAIADTLKRETSKTQIEATSHDDGGTSTSAMSSSTPAVPTSSMSNALGRSLELRQKVLQALAEVKSAVEEIMREGKRAGAEELVADLKSRIESLTASLEDLRRSHAITLSDLSAAQSQVKNLEQRLQSSESHAQTISSALSTAESEIVRLVSAKAEATAAAQEQLGTYERKATTAWEMLRSSDEQLLIARQKLKACEEGREDMMREVEELRVGRGRMEERVRDLRVVLEDWGIVCRLAFETLVGYHYQFARILERVEEVERESRESAPLQIAEDGGSVQERSGAAQREEKDISLSLPLDAPDSASTTLQSPSTTSSIPKPSICDAIIASLRNTRTLRNILTLQHLVDHGDDAGDDTHNNEELDEDEDEDGEEGYGLLADEDPSLKRMAKVLKEIYAQVLDINAMVEVRERAEEVVRMVMELGMRVRDAEGKP
ncbi:hypothetical protein HK102_009785 [Quaeritorhiza haematococci]|nr:hypothetical protein HK102_009785 [Quaeritorhiza haematococci]